MRWLIVLVLLASTAWARVPLRPTFAEISLQLDPVTPYKFLRGVTANQLATDSMEETRAGRAIPDAIRVAEHIPACASALGTVFGIYHKITALLVPDYEGRQMQSGGLWEVPPIGRHYGDEKYIMEALRGCMVGSGARDCATMTSPDVLDLLAIHVQDGACTEGSTVTLPPPTQIWNGQIEQQAMFRARMILPPLTAAEVGALDATQAALNAFGALVCNGQLPDPAPVFNAHLAFESLAATDTIEHAHALKPYRLVVDTRWTVTQRCRFAMLGAAAHQRWVDAVKAGHWGDARLADNDHWGYTICLGIADPRVLVRPTCGAPMDACPVVSCTQIAS